MLKIGFDVDGALIHQSGALCDTPRYEVISLFKWFSSIGCQMIVWSGGGTDYAKHWALKLGLEATILEKGSVEVDIAFDDEVVKLGKINVCVNNKPRPDCGGEGHNDSQSSVYQVCNSCAGTGFLLPRP